MIPALFVFLFMQSEIVREKEYKLRQGNFFQYLGLNIFGAKHSAYWMSWFIIAILYSLLTCFSSFLAGLAFGFDFFHQTSAYIIMFFLFFPFAFSMAMFGFMISTLVPTTNAANASSYGIVLLAIVVQSFTSDNNVVSLLFTDDAGGIVLFLRTFLIFYPPFSYTKVQWPLYRFSPTLPYIADFTSILPKELGSQALNLTISVFSNRAPLDHSLQVEPLPAIPISPQWV